MRVCGLSFNVNQSINCISRKIKGFIMHKFRFEKTQYGYKAFIKKNNAFIYIGHFLTKKAAKESVVNHEH